MPASRGRPLRLNGWSARAKTKGSTGRMHGLTIVRRPPMKAMAYNNKWLVPVERHFSVQPDLDGPAVFHRGTEPPLFKRPDRVVIQTVERADDANDFRRAVLEKHHVEHD